MEREKGLGSFGGGREGDAREERKVAGGSSCRKGEPSPSRVTVAASNCRRRIWRGWEAVFTEGRGGIEVCRRRGVSY